MTRTPEQIVSAEVHYCVSSLVSTIMNAYDTADEAANALAYQAIELASPIDDWEEAAIQQGWRSLPDTDNGIVWTRDEQQNDIDNEDGPPHVDTAQEACEFDHVEPYQREVF